MGNFYAYGKTKINKIKTYLNRQLIKKSKKQIRFNIEVIINQLNAKKKRSFDI